MVTLQHFLWLRKCLCIPGEIAPFVRFHPETVKMEYMQWDIPVCHPLYKTRGCRFVIICGKRRGQPQPERPCRRQCRFSSQFRIFADRVFRVGAIDHIIIQPLALCGKLQPFYFFAGDLKGHIPLVIHQDTITFIGKIEGNIFIGNLTGGPAVFIPHIHNLPVFDKRSKPFAQAVNRFIHIQGKLLYHIIPAGIIIFHISHIPVAGFRKLPVAIQKTDPPGCRTFIDHCLGMSALINDFVFRFLNMDLWVCLLDLDKRLFINSALKVTDGYFDHILHRTA